MRASQGFWGCLNCGEGAGIGGGGRLFFEARAGFGECGRAAGDQLGIRVEFFSEGEGRFEILGRRLVVFFVEETFTAMLVEERAEPREESAVDQETFGFREEAMSLPKVAPPLVNVGEPQVGAHQAGLVGTALGFPQGAREMSLGNIETTKEARREAGFDGRFLNFFGIAARREQSLVKCQVGFPIPRVIGNFLKVGIEMPARSLHDVQLVCGAVAPSTGAVLPGGSVISASAGIG